MTLEKKRAMLPPDWKLCVFRPTPDNMPKSELWGGSQYWNLSAEEKDRLRFYIIPQYPVYQSSATLYDTEEEALDAWIAEHSPARTGSEDGAT